MSSAVLMLPFPPSLNSIILCLRGRRIKSRAHREYLDEARFQLNQQSPLPKFTQPVQIIAHLGAPDKRRRDIDNHWKAAGDALQDAGVLADDGLIGDLRLLWDPAVTGCQVEIRPLGEG